MEDWDCWPPSMHRFNLHALQGNVCNLISRADPAPSTSTGSATFSLAFKSPPQHPRQTKCLSSPEQTLCYVKFLTYFSSLPCSCLP